MSCDHSRPLVPIGESMGHSYANCPDCHTTICRPLPLVRWWACLAERCVRWEVSDGEQYLAHLGDSELVGPDAPFAPAWLFPEAVAALADGGTRHAAFSGYDASWSAADDAMTAAYERRAA